MAEDGYRLWLRYEPVSDIALQNEYKAVLGNIVIAGQSELCQSLRGELSSAVKAMLDIEPVFAPGITPGNGLVIARLDDLAQAGLALDDMSGIKAKLGQEGFLLRNIGYGRVLLTAASDKGLLYGGFALLRQMQMNSSLADINLLETPDITCRILNHWDNIDGSTERVFSPDNKSIWWEYENDNPAAARERWNDYGRACCSVGINMVIVNNVNAHVAILSPEKLQRVTDIADVLRKWGIRTGISINAASCLTPDQEFRCGPGMGTCSTLDPLDECVISFWREQIDIIYNKIPDFAGFLVKAGSEGMPGPEKYGRTAAQAADMYGRLLAPYGGIVMWRTFTYDVDDPDQTKRQFIRFAPQDGSFTLDNVFLQNKFGSRDFMSREPFHPLFGAMPRTRMALELQVTQEYTGHDKYLMYWGSFWQEILQSDTYAKGPGSTVARVLDGTVNGFANSAIAGVANVSRVRNWTGHHFAAANWYACGRMCWDTDLDSGVVAQEWVRMTWGNDDEVVTKLTDMLNNSHEIMTSFVAPLGIAHTNTTDHRHYEPGIDARNSWQKQFINADKDGIGTDRTIRGTKATTQYQPQVAAIFDDPKTCPEGLLLWFHRFGWHETMPNGKTTIQNIEDKYAAGLAGVENMINTWQSLESKVDPERFQHVRSLLKVQYEHAQKYRNIWLAHFQKLAQSGQ
ncbi:MAG: hypothetical protein JXM68_06155 [Sedimentisphaerales bacterium]|nr:hypothetical protein [Sedimentisphaerales bacterium]